MTRYALLLALIAPFALAQENLAARPAARAMFWQLLADAGYGHSHQERAAFVVRAANGGYRCIAWDAEGLVDSARWEGPFPPGVVAIVHTHPNWLSQPSNVDANTARSTGVPVYVITRSRITRTTGDDPQVMLSGDWKPAADARPCSVLTRSQLARLRDGDAPAADFEQIELGSGARDVVGASQ